MEAIAQPSVLTYGLLGMIVLCFVIWALAIWLWGFFLDDYEHNPAKVRSVMLCILAVTTTIEMLLAGSDLTHSWVAVVALIVNAWGPLDALLRFPASHDVDSMFTLKQFSLVIIKTFAYGFGMNGFRQHIGIFLLIVSIIVWLQPVFYLMALPLDPAEQVAADDRDDVDVVIRLWLLLTCENERLRCLDACKRLVLRQCCSMSHTSPMAKVLLCATSPSYRRSVGRTCKV